jgi:hypothetical protein
MEMGQIKLNAAQRLSAHELLAADIKDSHLEKGHNTYRCKDPEDAYARAAHFIANLIKAGFAFFPSLTASKEKDTYKKGSVEISIWVCSGVLNIDLE